MDYEEIARVAHEINRAYCSAIGDNSLAAWADAPQWQRKSVVNGVQFHMDNPNVTPEESHENWLREKRQDGWKYGPVKDPLRKEHPCCVSYAKLPQEHRVKDFLFAAVVEALR